MNLRHYDFRKKADVRIAIDLLNSLIADCMVSEFWVREHVEAPDYLKEAVGADGIPIAISKQMLDDFATDMLYIREKTVKYWLSLHHALHDAIDERDISTKTLTYFELMWSMFDLNRKKLIAFMEKTPNPRGQCTSLRKQWYGQKHYFTKKDRDEEAM